MRGRIGRVVFEGIVLLFWLGVAVAAPQESGTEAEAVEIDPTTTRVIVGSASNSPGTSVVVPIYLTPADGAEVGRLKLDVNFVSTNLKFTKFEHGLAADMGKVDLSAEVKTTKNEKGVETSTLTVLASTSSAEPPAKGIPAGLLGYLTLQINEKGRLAKISLRATAEGTELKTNKPIQNLRAIDGKVEVVAPGDEPLVTCFFFSH